MSNGVPGGGSNCSSVLPLSLTWSVYARSFGSNVAVKELPVKV